MTARPWVKLWDTWYTSRSHLTLSPEAIHTGPRLLSLANPDPERGWLVDPAGRPLSVQVIARETRWPPDVIERVIAELVDAGTMTRREDLALGFADFGRYQETLAASRMRRMRNTERNKDASRYADVTDPVTTRGQRSEVRGKKTEIRDQRSEGEPPTAPASAPGFADDVLAAWGDMAAGAGLPTAIKLTKARRAKIKARTRDGLHTLDDWRAYFAAVAASGFATGANDRGWRADIDWAIRSDDVVTRVLEGRYADTEPVERRRPMTVPEKLWEAAEEMAEREAAEAGEVYERQPMLVALTGGES